MLCIAVVSIYVFCSDNLDRGAMRTSCSFIHDINVKLKIPSLFLQVFDDLIELNQLPSRIRIKSAGVPLVWQPVAS